MEHSDMNAQFRAKINQVWNAIVSQLGYWNTDKVAAIDRYEFLNLLKEGQVALLNEFAKLLGNLATVAYSHNLAIFGPKTLIESERFKNMFPGAVLGDVDYDLQILANNLDINQINNPGTSEKDIAARIRAAIDGPIIAAPNTYLQRILSGNLIDRNQIDRSERGGAAGRGPRRPPNAFILYRKDKAPEIKKVYPNIHNNEISVMVGALWRNESERIREAYHVASQVLNNHFQQLHPNYRYNPRRPNEIPRRATRPPRAATRTTRPVLADARGTKAPARDIWYHPQANIEATIQVSTVAGDEVPHSLPMDVQDALHARFPGVTTVRRGPVQTAVVQDLPFLARPITTMINNDNLRDLVAAHGSVSPPAETMLGTFSIEDTTRFSANTEQYEGADEAWDFLQAQMEEFVDFNAVH